MTCAPVLSTTGLTKSFGALRATDNLGLEVADGELHALIGPNGAGKSTLIKQLSGEMAPDAGRIRYRGRDITDLPAARRARLGIARSYQITSIFPDYTVLENVVMAVQARATRIADLWKTSAGDSALEDPADRILDQVGLSAERDRTAATLAHGQQRQLEVAMALALDPSLLLLDEPMAGMGNDETALLLDLLAGLRGRMTIILVEHDMDVVFALADRITVLVYGRSIATGSADEIRANREVREAYLGDQSGAA